MKILIRSCITLVVVGSIAVATPNGYTAPLPLAPEASTTRRPVLISGPAQSAVATKAAFGTASSGAVSKAISATDLTKAVALEGKEGGFQGTVASAYAPGGNELVILDFAQDYHTALTAVVFAKDFKSFPDLTTLTGKHVLITGKFIDYHGKPEIVMTKAAQVKLIM